jgi:hypothetical protein
MLDARSLGGQHKFPGVDPNELCYKVANIANQINPTAIFVDTTGVGASVAVRLRELGYPAHPVLLGSRAPEGDVRCANMRAYCWTMMAAWLKVGAIVNDAELKAQLCAPTYSETERGVVIEKKEHMADRGLQSPDCADALSLTFAYPVSTPAMNDLIGPGDHQVTSEWNPFSDAVMRGEPIPELKRKYTAPGYRLKPEWTHEGGWTGDDWVDAQASDALAVANVSLGRMPWDGIEQVGPDAYVVRGSWPTPPVTNSSFSSSVAASQAAPEAKPRSAASALRPNLK